MFMAGMPYVWRQNLILFLCDVDTFNFSSLGVWSGNNKIKILTFPLHSFSLKFSFRLTWLSKYGRLAVGKDFIELWTTVDNCELWTWLKSGKRTPSALVSLVEVMSVMTRANPDLKPLPHMTSWEPRLQEMETWSIHPHTDTHPHPHTHRQNNFVFVISRICSHALCSFVIHETLTSTYEPGV